MSDLVEKWKPTGLLDGLEEDRDPSPLARALEDSFQTSKDLSGVDNLERVVGMVLPAVSRAYMQTKVDGIDGEHFLFTLLRDFSDYERQVQSLPTSELDKEAEIVERFVDDYVENHLQ